MKYPLLNPENVTRDMISTFGGYNHNLIIGDNEFYDMKNLSSDSYPLMSTRAKRQQPEVKRVDYHDGGVHFTAPSNIVGMIFREKLYTLREDADACQLFGNDDPIALWEPRTADKRKPRTIIPMGAKLIIMPDKKIINLAENSPEFKDIDNNRTATSVTVQPCLVDGTVLTIDYIGDDIPDPPADGFVWGDTRNGTVVLKKYIASQSTWQNFLSTYVKITGTNIAQGFSVGDGVKISGFTDTDLTALNNVSIVKAIPDTNSLVVTGIVDPLPNHYLLTARFGSTDLQSSQRTFYCDSSVQAGDFANKEMLIGDHKYFCVSSTDAVEVTAAYKISELDLVDEIQTHQEKCLTVKTPTTSNIVYVNETINHQLFPLARKDYKQPIQVCFGDDLGHIFTVLGYGFESSPHEGASVDVTYYLVLNTDVTAAQGTAGVKIYPVEAYEPENKYSTTLTFNQNVTVNVGDRACPSIENQYAQQAAQGSSISFSRRMPKMDFVIEAGNRLWGCRYGKNADDEFVNEIYCSKLGDPTNWNVYEKISTDSYEASCGTDGEWTGAFNYRGHPTFFKEHYIHTAYGSNPPFQIKDIEARGIQKGSSLSLAMVNEVLFYKSIYGICAYTGGLPEEVSPQLGSILYNNAVGCAYKGKYYVEMQDSDNNPAFFIFDTTKGMWHKESPLNAFKMAAGGDNVFFTANARYNSASYTGEGKLFGNTEAPIRWSAESGIYGLNSPDKKYISRLNLRMMIPTGSSVFISIMYDSSGHWEKVTNVIGHSLMPFTLPIKPKRCDHFRIKIEGIGDIKLYSICKTIEGGSDR